MSRIGELKISLGLRRLYSSLNRHVSPVFHVSCLSWELASYSYRRLLSASLRTWDRIVRLPSSLDTQESLRQYSVQAEPGDDE